MIELKNVKYYYQKEEMHYSFQVAKQERVAILGPSGAGKSTLLNLIAGFICPDSGKIILNGKNTASLQPNERPVSMLFQENNLFTHLTIYQNMALGAAPSLRLSREQQSELIVLANKVGLSNQLNRYPHQLSVGQKQRVAILRCLLQKRPILLLDEPFSALDSSLRYDMLNLVDEITQKYELTLMMVTHNIDDAIHIAPRTLIIENGHIAFDGPTVKVQESTLEL